LDSGVPATWEEVFVLAERAQGTVAAPLIAVDAVCAFLALCDRSRDGGWPPSRDTAATAIEILERLAATAHPASLAWNPPALLEHMATSDDVAYCPLAFGYAS